MDNYEKLARILKAATSHSAENTDMGEVADRYSAHMRRYTKQEEECLQLLAHLSPAIIALVRHPGFEVVADAVLAAEAETN